MKRKWLVFPLVLGLFLASPLAAGSYERIRFGLNAGVISDDGFGSFWWQVGSTLDVPLTARLVLAPELTLISSHFDFDYLYLYPGATLNYRFGDEAKHLFVGGGTMLYFRIKPKMSPGDGTQLVPKAQIGYRYRNIKITAYLYSFTKGGLFLKEMYLGLNLGILL